MKVNKLRAGWILTLFSFALISCEKQEGEGGASQISGKVFQIQFDASFQTIVDTVPASDEDIFIIYGGENGTYDDDFKTSFDGSYRFKFLQKGKYRLFAYSEDSTGAYNGNMNPDGREVPSFIDVVIDKNGDDTSAPDLYILKNNQ